MQNVGKESLCKAISVWVWWIVWWENKEKSDSTVEV
jgi:hypothetical protein